MTATVDDTYAEAFRSIYAEVLITARDRTWLDHAVAACTGNASSTIFCDCEAGLDRYVGPGGDESFATPDGRPGAVVQFHVPPLQTGPSGAARTEFAGTTEPKRAHLPDGRLFQPDRQRSVLQTRKEDRLLRGRLAIPRRTLRSTGVGDSDSRRRVRHRPSLRLARWSDGGNLWYLGDSVDSALEAAVRGTRAVAESAGVIMPFPGGIAGSGSKAGSRYKFSIASTYEKFCPTLREKLGEGSAVPEGVKSIMEIILNGRDLATIARATHAAIAAMSTRPGWSHFGRELQTVAWERASCTCIRRDSRRRKTTRKTGATD